MPKPRRTSYVSVSMAPDVRDGFQQEALTLSASVGRRLTMTDVARAALAVARAHPDEFRDQLDRSRENQ